MKKRNFQLIEKLFSDQPQISIKELAESLKVSTRTIRNDIDEINFLLKELSINPISIDRGYAMLSLTSDEKTALIKALYEDACSALEPKQRELKIILDFVKYPRKFKIYQEGQKLSVSKSTVDGDMRRVRKYVSKFSLTVSAEDGGEIVGNEKNIQTMLWQLISTRVDIVKLVQENMQIDDIDNYLIKEFLGRDAIKCIRDLFEDIFQESNIGLASGVAINSQAVISLCIWINRLNANCHVKGVMQNFQNINDDRIKKIVDEVIDKYHLNASKYDISFMYYTLRSLLVRSNNNLKVWTKAQTLTVELINYMSNCEGVDFGTSEQLFEQLNTHIISFLQRRIDKVTIYNPLVQIMKQNYTTIFNDISDFFQQKNLNISDDEKAYMTVYFGTYLEKLRIESTRYRIAVLCNYGKATGHLLAANLAGRLNVDILAILGSNDLSALNHLNVDFVVKTIDIPTLQPSILLPPVPRADDYKRLSRFIDKLHIEPRDTDDSKDGKGANLVKKIIELTETNFDQKVSSKYVDDLVNVLVANDVDVKEREVWPVIESLLTDDKIQIHLEAKDWREAIEKAADPLLKDGAINKNYVKAMQDSVTKYGAYIVIGPGLALAHARPEDGASKLDVSVASLKTPVNFGSEQNDPVKIIFVLSAIDNYSHLNILKSIIELINEDGKVDELDSANTVAEFKKILFRKLVKEKE